jgi:hypothetical protein
MRKVFIIVVLVLLAVTALVSTGSEAKGPPKLPPGIAPPDLRLFAFGANYGFPLMCEQSTGSWTEIYNAWGTQTVEQRQQFIDTVDIQATIDGKPVNYTLSLDSFDGVEAVFFTYYLTPMSPGEHEFTMTLTFTEDHFDGVDLYPAGTVHTGSRVLVITPFAKYPSGNFEACPL